MPIWLLLVFMLMGALTLFILLGALMIWLDEREIKKYHPLTWQAMQARERRG